jgi:phage N-6-adenine-methyltransferase
MSNLTRVMFKSTFTEWRTPRALFLELDKHFGFTLDVCATPGNTQCVQFFSPEQDGLVQSWAGNICWCNPPYGREIGRWLRKAYEEGLKGVTTVCLIPARTDTIWWHEYVMRGAIHLIRGRLRFEGAESSAPFPSAIVVFGYDMLSESKERAMTPWPCHVTGCNSDGRYNVDGFHYCKEHRGNYYAYVNECLYYEGTGEMETWADDQMQAWREKWAYLWGNTADDGTGEEE